MTDQVGSKLVIKSEEERLVYAEVYAPNQIDTDGEAMTVAEVKSMAHSFLASGKVAKIDVGHNRKESGCLVVESFLARQDDPDGFLEGAWVLGVKVLPDELWDQIKKGELNGFSFQGAATRVEADVQVKLVRKMVGETEESQAGGLLPVHAHSLDLVFNDEGQIVQGITGFSFGHKHPVRKATATMAALEHSHRMVLIEN